MFVSTTLLLVVEEHKGVFVVLSQSLSALYLRTLQQIASLLNNHLGSSLWSKEVVYVLWVAIYM